MALVSRSMGGFVKHGLCLIQFNLYKAPLLSISRGQLYEYCCPKKVAVLGLPNAIVPKYGRHKSEGSLSPHAAHCMLFGFDVAECFDSSQSQSDCLYRTDADTTGCQ
jgi:hypothetical protein